MNELVTFDQAQLLKELGFEEEINTYFEETNPWYTAYTYTHINHNAYESQCRISRPTVSHALDWCREVKGIITGIDWWVTSEGVKKFTYGLAIISEDSDNYGEGIGDDSPAFNTYSEAQSAALDAALEYIKQQNP